MIAVGSGFHVFLYKNLQPFFKFTLPPIEIDQDEQDVWNKLCIGKYDAKIGHEELLKLREQGRQLTNRSYEILSLSDKDEITAFIEQRKAVPLNTHVKPLPL